MAIRKEYKIKLISKEFLNADTCYLGFECPEIAGSAVPGQFVNISAGTVFLKRPFGIASVDREKGTFNIGVKVVGKGTEQIAKFETGMEVDCLGPLGNGFDFEGFENVILTGGGTGVFPINFAYEELTRQGKNVTVCEGFRNAQQVILNKDGSVREAEVGDAIGTGVPFHHEDSVQLFNQFGIDLDEVILYHCEADGTKKKLSREEIISVFRIVSEAGTWGEKTTVTEKESSFEAGDASSSAFLSR